MRPARGPRGVPDNSPTPPKRPFLTPLKVAFATPELLSLVRRTNLAEIAEYLPRTLVQLGVDVEVFLPFTRDVDVDRLGELEDLGTISYTDAEGSLAVDLHRGSVGGVSVILVDHPELFRSRHPYGDENGPYADNWRRFAVFARAVLGGLSLAKFKPDVLHCLDWTSGLIPVYHKLEVLGNPSHPAHRAGTFFGVHNLAMQGSFEREILPKINVPHRLFKAIEGVEMGGKVNYLKAGAEFATIVGTHSPQQVAGVDDLIPAGGMEESFKRRKKELVGIMNGIDYQQWDPRNDSLLAQNFGPDDTEQLGKRKCKAALQTSLNLDKSSRLPILAMVGRFDADNGFDILAEAITPLLERNLQLVLMGPGSPEVFERMHTIEQTFAGRCRVIEGYNVNTAHMVLAGADVAIMPGHHHPTNSLCAIGMRYGVVPLSYAGSGLEDTVITYDKAPKKATGFQFNNYSTESLIGAVDEIRNIYKKTEEWLPIVARCLAQDFSWEESGRAYIKAYRRVTRRIRSNK